MKGLSGHGVALSVYVTCAATVPAGAQTPVVPPPMQQVEGPSQPLFATAAPLFAAPDLLNDEQQPAGPIPTPRHTGIHALLRGVVSDVRHLPSRENLVWVGIGSGLALVAHPFDDNVNRTLVGSKTADRIFKPGAVLGQIGTLLGTAGTIYAFGRLSDEPKVSHIGMDLVRAVAISESLAQVLKYSSRRERPDQSDHKSFPSGHAADTFAFATAFERHMGWRYAIPAYMFSSYVAISRVPANRHWLSDAVFGTTVGIIAGRTVTGHELNKFPVTVAYVPGGAAVMYVKR